MIYEACVSDKKFSDLKDFHSMTRVNRSIRRECLPTFDNHFCRFPTTNSLYHFLLSIGPTRRQHLRRLSFCYYPESDSATGEPKWENIILTKRAFDLIAQECLSLAELTIYVNERKLRRHFNMCHNYTNFSKGMDYHFCDIGTTYGTTQLRRIRGVIVMSFRPEEGTVFSSHAHAVFLKEQDRMMLPRETRK